jgi:DegV family protein with EDD domain
MAIKFITDSTAYLPESIIKEKEIEVLSLSVSFGEDVYKETEISHEFFYKTLQERTDFPKSSQPALTETQSKLEKILEAGHDVIGVFLSSEMSGTFQTTYLMAESLKEKYPNQKIEILDSKTNCMQLGLCVLKGIEGSKKGFRAGVDAVKHTISNSRFVFIPETLEFLKRGGRIGSAKALLSSMLQIKPILTVAEGKTHVMSKVRTRKKAMETLIELYNKDGKSHKITETYIHHIDCEEDAKKLSQALKGDFKRVPIGPVIGTHVGPGAIGIAYCWE